MASKSANVTARVEPEIKEQAESIMNQIGVPVSVVINLLYKQIIMTRSIPFPLSVPEDFPIRDEMSTGEFHTVMKTGLKQAQSGESKSAADVFQDVKQGISYPEKEKTK